MISRTMEGSAFSYFVKENGEFVNEKINNPLIFFMFNAAKIVFAENLFQTRRKEILHGGKISFPLTKNANRCMIIAGS